MPQFSQNAAKRIVAATRVVERSVRNHGEDRARFFDFGGEERIRARLTEALGSAGSAKAKIQVRDMDQRKWVDDPDQTEEVTVIEMAKQFCGLKGELIEVEPVGEDGDGKPIYEVTRGGRTWHKATIAQGAEKATVTVNGESVEVTVTFAFGLSSSEVYGTIAIEYESEDGTWNATEAPCGT